jgi:hypothetical protein
MGVKRWEDITHAGSPIRRQIGLDTVENKIVTRACQPNINECLEQNEKEFNETIDGPFNRGGPDAWTKVASIPLWLLEKWKVEEGIDFYRWNEEDKAKIIRKLNDRDYLKLRTAKGTL